MGFFSSFSKIGKIYDCLKAIEKDMIKVQRALDQNEDFIFKTAFADGVRNLENLNRLVDSSDETVLCADFEFCGRKLPIQQHMMSIAMFFQSRMNEYTYR